MKRAIALAGAAVIAAALSACASGPHTQASMATGTHVMPGPKGGVMPDRSMPSHSADCTEAALATMPAEHRAACEKVQEQSSQSQVQPDTSTTSGQHVMPAPKGGVMPNASTPSGGN